METSIVVYFNENKMIYNHKLHMGESPKHKSEWKEANTKRVTTVWFHL